MFTNKEAAFASLSTLLKKTRSYVKKKPWKNSELTATIALSLIGISYFGPDHFWPAWVTLYFFLVLLLSFDTWKNYSKAIAVLLCYLLLHVIYLGAFRLTPYDSMAAIDRLVLKYHAMEYGFCVVLFICAGKILSFYKIRTARVLSTLFYVHFIYTNICMLWFAGPYGFTGNYGMNTGLMAVLSCFVPMWWMLPVGVAVILSGASSPLLVFGVILALRLWGKTYGRVLVFLSAVLAAGFVTLNPIYLSDSTRFDHWGRYWAYFVKADQMVLGMGTEVFKSFGPYIQTTSGTPQVEWLLWAHNEYLEVLFNYGFIGLGLVLWVCILGAYYAYRRRNMAVVYGIAGMMAMSVTNYPLRLAPTCIVFLLLIHSAFREKTYDDIY